MFTIKRKNHKFSDKVHPISGIIATILAALSGIALIVSTYISSYYNGKASLIVGMIGMLAFIVSIAGFICALKSIRKEEIYYVFPSIGIIFNGILMVVYFVLYVIGMV